jgi:hypothetical protein
MRLLRPFDIKSVTPLPAMLAVDGEARYEMLNSYNIISDNSSPKLPILRFEPRDVVDGLVQLCERLGNAYRTGIEDGHNSLTFDFVQSSYGNSSYKWPRNFHGNSMLVVHR